MEKYSLLPLSAFSSTPPLVKKSLNQVHWKWRTNRKSRVLDWTHWKECLEKFKDSYQLKAAISSHLELHPLPNICLWNPFRPNGKSLNVKAEPITERLVVELHCAFASLAWSPWSPQNRYCRSHSSNTKIHIQYLGISHWTKDGAFCCQPTIIQY